MYLMNLSSIHGVMAEKSVPWFNAYAAPDNVSTAASPLPAANWSPGNRFYYIQRSHSSDECVIYRKM